MPVRRPAMAKVVVFLAIFLALGAYFAVHARFPVRGRHVLSLTGEPVSWMELSQENGQKKYVDDGEIIKQVVTLFSNMKLRPVTPEEAKQIKGPQTENTSQITVTFIQRVNQNGVLFPASRGSFVLSGNSVTIGKDDYVSEPRLAARFAAILEEINRQGKAKNAEDIPGKKAMTLDVVKDLAAGRLTPADVVNTYDGLSILSGIYSFYSRLPEKLAFSMEFVSIDKPRFIRLVDSNNGEFIDLTTESVDAFLANRKDCGG